MAAEEAREEAEESETAMGTERVTATEEDPEADNPAKAAEIPEEAEDSQAEAAPNLPAHARPAAARADEAGQGEAEVRAERRD